MTIFISYRRSDGSGYSGRLYDRLVQTLGPSNVFMDIDTIEPGADFKEVIGRHLQSCQVVLAIIGRHWLSASRQGGRSRLDSPQDFVRVELLSALKRNVTVIPVLVAGATLPRPTDLPSELRPLLDRQAFVLSDERFHSDVDRLIAAIGKLRNTPDADQSEIHYVTSGSLPAPALDGTRWDSTDSKGRTCQFEFLGNSRLRYTQVNETFDYGTAYENGKWRQNGSLVFFETGDGFARYDGQLTANNLLEGKAANLTGHKWTWTARRIG